MKSIGEAVRDYGNENKADVVTMGIVPSEYKSYWDYLRISDQGENQVRS